MIPWRDIGVLHYFQQRGREVPAARHSTPTQINHGSRAWRRVQASAEAASASRRDHRRGKWQQRGWIGSARAGECGPTLNTGHLVGAGLQPEINRVDPESGSSTLNALIGILVKLLGQLALFGPTL